MADEEKINNEVTQGMIDNFIDEKFPKADPEDLDYSNPLDAAEQIKSLKVAKAKRNIGPFEAIRRLRSGRKFE